MDGDGKMAKLFSVMCLHVMKDVASLDSRRRGDIRKRDESVSGDRGASVHDGNRQKQTVAARDVAVCTCARSGVPRTWFTAIHVWHVRRGVRLYETVHSVMVLYAFYRRRCTFSRWAEAQAHRRGCVAHPPSPSLSWRHRSVNNNKRQFLEGAGVNSAAHIENVSINGRDVAAASTGGSHRCAINGGRSRQNRHCARSNQCRRRLMSAVACGVYVVNQRE
jgi:hypothetical protein